jgi:hypothetical protein
MLFGWLTSYRRLGGRPGVLRIVSMETFLAGTFDIASAKAVASSMA